MFWYVLVCGIINLLFLQVNTLLLNGGAQGLHPRAPPALLPAMRLPSCRASESRSCCVVAALLCILDCLPEGIDIQKYTPTDSHDSPRKPICFSIKNQPSEA